MKSPQQLVEELKSGIRHAAGLGDFVATVAEVTGVKAVVERVNNGPCGGCAARQAALNKAFPFGKREEQS